ncbi:MAG: prolipoprotein diacylglyceryl transferase [Micrococcales bacterium]
MRRILESIPSPSENFFLIGNYQLRYYAVLILVGIIFAIWIGAVRLKQRGVDAGVALDVALWAVPMGIVGARIFHVLTHLSDYFGKPGIDPLSFLYIWEGGIAIYGGLIGGVIGAWLGAKSNGVRFLAVADAFAPGLILAQGIGRWGNYFNNELFGIPTNLPWGLEIKTSNPAYPAGLPEGVLFHPTFLYESLWDILGVFVLLLLERKLRLQWGRLFAAYLIYYSIGRSLIESIRIDPSAIILGLRTNVWSAIFGVAVGIALFWWSKRQYPGEELSPYIPGREPNTEETKPAKKSSKKSSSQDFELDASEVNSDVSDSASKAK